MARKKVLKIYDLNLARAATRIQKKKVTIGVVGFGYIGSVIGAVLASRGFRTVGVDTNKKLRKEINGGSTSIHEPGLKELIRKSVKARKLSVTSDFRVLQNVDIIIITVGTPLGETYAPDLSHITAAAESVSSNLRQGQLVIMKSTIVPGTTEGAVREILEESGLRAGHDFGLVFSPERLAEGKAIAEFLSLPIVVGGFDAKSAMLAARFWELALGVKTAVVSDAKTAEMSKLADNVWIDLNIAVANEIALLCDRIGIDALEVIRAANTLPKSEHNVNILMPGMGVGGYCLTKDPWFMRSIGKQHGLNLKIPAVSRRVNAVMPVYTFHLIKKSLQQQGKQLKNSKVAILGLSFKSNTGDCRFTPTKHTLGLLENNKCKLSVYDPLVSKADAKTVTKIPMANSIEAAVRGADCIAFFTGHDIFREFPLKKLRELANKTCSLVDGRNMYAKNEIKKIKKLGFIYKGIGRI